MKVKIETICEPKFSPFTVSFTIDNIDDARELWHRLNIASVEIKNIIDGIKYQGGCLIPNFEKSDLTELWDSLDDYMDAHGLK